MKKIIWITNSINQVGGVERVICNLSNYFSTMGYNVVIYSLNSRESNNNKPFFKIDDKVAIRHCGNDISSQSRLRLIISVRRVLTEENPDIVIGCHEPVNNAIIINKNSFNGKIISTMHCSHLFFSKKRILLTSLLYRFSDCFLVLTENDYNYFLKRGIKNCRIMPNALSDEQYPISKLNSKTIISVGRLTKVKGFDHLIEAFNIVHSIFPQWSLIILGDGEERKNLQNKIDDLGLNDCVFLKGFTRDVPLFLSQSSIFVCSSESEGFSLVVLEAMACGLPIISYNLPAIKEITGGNAKMVEIRNPQALSKAIIDIISSEDKLLNMSKMSLVQSQKYSINNIGREWVTIFEGLGDE